MRDDSPAAVALFREELRLCGVEPGSSVAVVASEGKLAERILGITAAARSLGATCYALVVAPFGLEGTLGIGHTPLAGQRDLVELLKRADLVIDLVFLDFAAELNELLDAGVRVISIVEPLPMLLRLLPTIELRRRVEAAVEQLRAARELRVTSAAGTDLLYQMGSGLRVLDEYGFTTTPGRWDNWPSGFVAANAREGGVDGMLVLNSGDAVLLPTPHIVREPVHMSIKDGYIVDIAGDNLDAMVLRDFFPDSSEDRDAYAVAHIGWGLNKDARWASHPEPGILQMEYRAFCGNVMFSTGPNTDMGGTRTTPYHLDIPMRDCTLELDAQTMVDRGRLVVPEQQ